MITPPKPQNEQERLAALYEYNILDTLPEEEYDAITRIASEICGTPMALVSLVGDKVQFSKAATGSVPGGAPRELSFCTHAINEPGKPFVVPNSALDKRFFDNPYVTGEPYVMFYAGIPLVTEDGYALGALCVMDSKPRELSKSQEDTLTALANQVMCLLELRRNKQELEQKQGELKEINKALEKFAYVAAHDLKSPTANIVMLSRLLRDNADGKLEEKDMEMLDMLENASSSMNKLVDGILKHTRNAHMIKVNKEQFTFEDLMQEVKNMLLVPAGITFSYEGCSEPIVSAKTALIQVLHNLCENAIKYNDKEKGCVKVTCETDEEHYIFKIADNGVGIPEEEKDNIFELFHTMGTTDRFHNRGTGIGLSTVKKLVEKLDGSIGVTSKLGEGTTFTVAVHK